MRTYQQAIEYLQSFINYERRPPRDAGKEFSLEGIQTLLARLRDPQRSYPTIHIAGSKGKGSTAALCESMLRAAGYRTGLYTSPHLHTFRERMRVDGQIIDRDPFAALLDELEPHLQAVEGITWFEVLTALAFLFFERSKVEVGIIEVGLGGRFDATNVLNPLVSAITSLSLEHTQWLGNSIEEIAFEKAGIIKPGKPVVSAPQPPAALAVLERISAERNAPLIVVGRDVAFERLATSLDRQAFTMLQQVWQTPLLGAHQVINAAVALTTLKTSTLLLDDEALREGMRQTHWPGRMEILRRDPPFVIDGAHNGDSVQRLVETLRELFPGEEWTLIFGALADKDIRDMLQQLLPISTRVIVTSAQNTRAINFEEIAQMVREQGRDVECASSVRDALTRAAQASAPLIVTGSIYVIAEAREAWFERKGTPITERDA